jgi:hypothetical protein
MAHVNFTILTFINEKIDILNAYIKFGEKIFHLTWEKKGKSKTCHKKSEEKSEFKSLGMNP